MDNRIGSFMSKFNTQELNIYENYSWTWSLNPQHNTLGASILSGKRFNEKFSDITEKEGVEFMEMIRIIESTINKSFNYDKINYLMLMMIDPHLHFHVIPRYKTLRLFAGDKWTDHGWPTMPKFSLEDTDLVILREIRDELRKNLMIK